jgi:hypothetical protein
MRGLPMKESIEMLETALRQMGKDLVKLNSRVSELEKRE